MSLANDYINKPISLLRVCRGCLATDVRLYDMRQNRLMEAYCTLLRTDLQVTDDLPHYLCSYCAALLLKCDTFRIKCVDALIVLRNAQHQNLYLTKEHIKITERSKHLKQSEIKTIDIDNKSTKRKRNYLNVYTDTDISSESDVLSDSNERFELEFDVSFDSDETIDIDSENSDYSVSEDEKKLISRAKSIIREHKTRLEQDNVSNNSNNEIELLLKKHFGECRGLLKDFEVNKDYVETNTSNIKNYRMKQLSEIISHIQYSSETSTDLLEILDENPIKWKNKATKMTQKTQTGKIVKQESKTNAIAKNIHKHVSRKGKVQQKTKTQIEPDIVNKESKKQSPWIEKKDMKEEVCLEETTELEPHYDEVNETFDPEEDIAIADLKLNSKPSKSKKIKHAPTSAKGAPKFRGCKKMINGILKGRKTKKVKFSEELYAMYNTEVRYLSQEEQLEEINARKKSDNYKNGQFKCNFCFKGFLIEETFDNHMSLHDDISGKFVCDICQCHFLSKRRLYGHKKVHSKVFTCKECGHTTRHGSLAAQHYRWHGGKKYSCKDCGKEFQNKSSQYGHMKLCHPTSEQLVRCEICGDSFNGLAGLKYHDNRTHKEMHSPECYCSGCETQFYSSDAFKTHQGSDGACDPRAKCCVRCGMAFETQQLLEEHEIEQRKPQNQFKCEKCNKTFKFFGKLKMHQRRHSATYPKYIKMYYERKGKSDKEREEHGSEELICEICGKLVKNVGLLKLHYNMAHSADKPFKCTMCPKAFKTSALLVGHIRVHTGERPFQCQHCPKAFQNPQNLKRHNIVHTGERPHSCDVCGKSFQSKGCVKTHIKTVHMKIPMPPRIRHRKKKTEC